MESGSTVTSKTAEVLHGLQSLPKGQTAAYIFVVGPELTFIYIPSLPIHRVGTGLT